jgi:ribosomal protein S18 acetylase RimI-like enzyme
MEIRRVRPDEWEAFRALRLRALAGDPDAFGGTFEGALVRTDAEWCARIDAPERPPFVAVADDGRFVGMAGGRPVAERPGTAGLYGMWVAPEARRHGIGSALIDAVEGWARSAGYTSLGLGVTMTNPSAIRLYERKGYVDIGERHPLRETTDLTIQIMGKTL